MSFTGFGTGPSYGSERAPVRLAAARAATVAACSGASTIERVGAWLAQHVAGSVPPFAFELIAGGHSNLTFKATDANGWRLVVRRPPLGHVLATAHDMAREHRIVSALGPTAVPVAPTYGLCEDEEVNGAPFYVMGFVDGVVLDHPDKSSRPQPWTPGAPRVTISSTCSPRCTPSTSTRSASAIWPAVTATSNASSSAGRSSGRRPRRASSRPSRRCSAGSWPECPSSTAPPSCTATTASGNCLVDPATGSIAAVLDWELCTLGDPLADVGYLCVYWTDRGQVPRRANDPTAAGGFPTKADAARALRPPHRP